jgi:hypothetical protein
MIGVGVGITSLPVIRSGVTLLTPLTTDRWIVEFATGSRGSEVAMRKVELRGAMGGPDLATGGTAISSGGTGAASAFDANIATAWVVLGVGAGSYIGYQKAVAFGPIVQVSLYAWAPGNAPTGTMNIKYWNGTAFITDWTVDVSAAWADAPNVYSKP